MKQIIVFLMCFIIVLSTGCVVKDNTDTSDLTDETISNKSNNESYDISELPLTVYNIDSLCVKINNSKKSGNSEWVFTINNVNEIEKVVYPELNNSNFYLIRIDVYSKRMFYYFMPKDSIDDTSISFNYNEGIVVTVSRDGTKEDNAFEAVKKQHNLKTTKDGYLYNEEHNKLYIPYDYSWISIRVPDELNTYETLTDLCTFKEIVP